MGSKSSRTAKWQLVRPKEGLNKVERVDRQDLLEFLEESNRDALLSGLEDEAQDDPIKRAELLAGLDAEQKEQIASDIAEKVYDAEEAYPLTEILRRGNLQAVEMTVGLVLNRPSHNNFYGIAVDCGDDTKAAVVKELGEVLKELSASTNPEDAAIMVEIARETSSFVGNLEEKDDALASAVEDLTTTIQGFDDTEANRVIASLFRLDQLVANMSKSEPTAETKTGNGP